VVGPFARAKHQGINLGRRRLEDKISRSEADRILQIEESHYIDLKAIEAEPASLSETVAAFATHGWR
jgi:hypothetical protein